MDEGEVVDMLMDEFDAEEISADAAAAPDNPETNDDVEEVG